MVLILLSLRFEHAVQENGQLMRSEQTLKIEMCI